MNFLTAKVLYDLTFLVKKSKHKSIFTKTRALKVNIFNYIELVLIRGNLMFLDNNGDSYFILNSEATINELIEIISKNK